MNNYWTHRHVLVTGGASFIGSHLVDALVSRGAQVRVVDDLSSGYLENIQQHLTNGVIDFSAADLREPGVARQAMKGIKIVFHLAADHGGRGYVDTHSAGPASNLHLDGVVFSEALKAGVEKMVFASSGCVYPNYVQQEPEKELYLTEDLVKPPYDADNMYGWAKLMGELTLQAYHREFGLKAASCRYFTVYGPRAKENHAVMAMIAKAFIRENPFEVWGTGAQIRNWTYVEDIVHGTISAAEKVDNAAGINLGTMERIQVIDAARLVCKIMGHDPKFVPRPDLPTGPLNRVSDNRLAMERLGWEPKVSFKEGAKRTIEWYVRNKKADQVRYILKAGGLIKRKI